MKKQSGFTIIEMLVTIVVASMLTVILMQILFLTVKANIDLDTRNRYQYESYIMSETVRDLIFDLQAQELEMISDTDTETVIELRHLYGYTTDIDGKIIQDPDPITHILRLDKNEGNLYYNGELINNSNVHFGPNSSISLISIDSTSCDLLVSACDEGVLELSLEIIVLLPDGGALSPQVFVTRILI